MKELDRETISENIKTRDSGNKKLLLSVLVVVLVLIVVVVLLIKKFMPSSAHRSLNEYFGASDGEVQIIMQDSLSEIKGIKQEGHIYVPFGLVHDELNSRFYWDSNENLLLYTTSTAVITVEAGSKKFLTNKSSETLDYNISVAQGDTVYIALDFVKLYTAMDYKAYEKPDRVVITYKYGEKYQYADANQDASLRAAGDIKSPILSDVKSGDKLMVVDIEETEKGFYQVQTEDGVVGFVKAKCLGDKYEYQPRTDFKEEKYSHILLDEKINLVWHQVTNQAANSGLNSLIANTKGVNVVAPTWFGTSDNHGNIFSYADDDYVRRAHSLGLQVWGLCDDFSPDMKIGKVLGTTTRRQKLAKNLVAEAIRHSLDGINIDFEHVRKESADDFIQFIREIGIMCRNNGLVLSIDNYPPTDYSEYYNRTEQAAVADYVITMSYDEYNNASETAGPVSSITYVKDSTTNTVAQVPAEQTIIALPFYSRLWKETTKGGETKLTSEALSMASAKETADDAGSKVRWDEQTMMNYTEYKKGKVLYKIWIEDKKSLEEKLKVVAGGNVAGVAFWKLGLESEDVWNTVAKYVN